MSEAMRPHAAFPAQSQQGNRNSTALKHPEEQIHGPSPVGGTLGRTGLEHQGAAGVPAAAMQPLTAEPAGQAPHPAAVGSADAAAGAAGDPGGRGQRQGVVVAQAHLELTLDGVDPGHGRAELGTVHLTHLQHPIDPGVDHLVAERSQGGTGGEGRQHRP